MTPVSLYFQHRSLKQKTEDIRLKFLAAKVTRENKTFYHSSAQESTESMEVHYKPTGSYLKCCMLYRQLNVKNRLQSSPSFYPEVWCFITKSCCWKAWGREEPTQKDALLVNCLSTVWISCVEIGVCLGLRDRKVIKFKISVDRRKCASKKLNSGHEENWLLNSGCSGIK